MFLGLLGWMVVGVLIGFIATKAVNLHGDDPRLSIAVAGVGAIAGGALYSLVRRAEVTAWSPWSILFAAIGAVAAAVIWHAVRSRFVSKAAYTTRRSY
jgi:uncharacterized membrane protein YeaQ/YmgE (transglycosylase-associated protein family)